MEIISPPLRGVHLAMFGYICGCHGWDRGRGWVGCATGIQWGEVRDVLDTPGCTRQSLSNRNDLIQNVSVVILRNLVIQILDPLRTWEWVVTHVSSPFNFIYSSLKLTFEVKLFITFLLVALLSFFLPADDWMIVVSELDWLFSLIVFY